MTAYGSSDVQKEANQRGSLFYIEKPFEISDIRKIIIDLIGKKRGFQGKVFGLQLTDIIQMNCLSRLTTALVITRDGDKGSSFSMREKSFTPSAVIKREQRLSIRS